MKKNSIGFTQNYTPIIGITWIGELILWERYTLIN